MAVLITLVEPLTKRAVTAALGRKWSRGALLTRAGGKPTHVLTLLKRRGLVAEIPARERLYVLTNRATDILLNAATHGDRS